MRLLILMTLPILAGLINYMLPRGGGKVPAVVIQLFSLGMAVYNFTEVNKSGIYTFVVGNYEEVAGIRLMADPLSSAMILLTVFTFFICIIYSKNNTKLESHFFFIYLVLQSCMIGLFLTRDLFNIFVIVEVCTIIVAILIMYKNEDSLYDSLVYLLNNIVAMTFFAFGVAILYKSMYTLDIDLLSERMTAVEVSGRYMVAYALMLTGIGFKCALMPMFSWLPRAHAAKGVPIAVSAILSGLYIKTGVFVFMRLRVMFLPIINIDSYLLIVAMVTSLMGVRMAIKQKNIKLILAYHTISQVGLIMVGLLVDNYNSYNGAIYHMINHAVFKSTLFLCAGIYMDYYGHKNIKKMKGAMKGLPLVSTACIFAVFGITGAPFFNGSVSKYFIQYGTKGVWYEYVIILINTGTVISFLKFFKMMFGEVPSPVKEKKICRYRSLSVFIMGAACLLGGVFAHNIMEVVLGFTGIVDPLLYLEKTIIYFVTLGGCWFLYNKEWLNFITVDRGGGTTLSFNGISVMTCIFFMVTVTAIYLNNFIA